MSTGVVPPDREQIAKELADRLRYVKFITVENSALPVRVIKRRTGATLGSFETQDKADTFLLGVPMEHLNNSVTRGKQGNTRDRR